MVDLANRIVALLNSHPADVPNLAAAWTAARTLLQEVDDSPAPTGTPEHLTTQLNQLNEAYTDLEKRNDQAEAALDESRSTIATLTGAHRGSKKMPDAPKYSGKPEELRPFVAQLRLKLGGERDHFPTVQNQLAYAVNRLEGAALDQLMPYILDDRVNLADLPAFVTILETAFGDPDRRRTAERRLHTLKQASRDFSTYFAEFQRYAADTQYDDHAKRSFLRIGLSREMIEALQHRDEPENFLEFVQLLQRVANKLKDTQQELGTRRYQPNRDSRPSAPPAPRPQQSAPAPAPVQGPALPPAQNTSNPSYHGPAQNTSNPSYHGPAPMDLSSGRRMLPPAERSRRLSEGLCLYCGGMGHMAALCPNKRRPLRAAASGYVPASPYVSVSPYVPVPVTPASSVSFSSSSDPSVSGKE